MHISCSQALNFFLLQPLHWSSPAFSFGEQTRGDLATTSEATVVGGIPPPPVLARLHEEDEEAGEGQAEEEPVALSESSFRPPRL